MFQSLVSQRESSFCIIKPKSSTLGSISRLMDTGRSSTRLQLPRCESEWTSYDNFYQNLNNFFSDSSLWNSPVFGTRKLNMWNWPTPQVIRERAITCAAAQKLELLMDMTNETVGDAISDLLIVETILHAKGWSVQDWNKSYQVILQF